MRRLLLTSAAIVAAAIFAPHPALADAPTFSVGAQAGTTGYGPVVGVELSKNTAVRLATGNISVSGGTQTSSDETYTTQLHVNSFSALLDEHIGRSIFIVTGGFISPNLTLSGTATPNSGTVVVNGNTYTVTNVGSLNGQFKWNTTAPYIGLGFGPRLGKHHAVKVALDAGVAFIGSPSVNITATGPIASNPQFQSDLAAETQKLKNSINLSTYPVVDLNVTYTF